MLTVVNLDPWHAAEGVLSLDLNLLGLPWDRPYEAYDELSNQSFTWQGAEPYVRLDPYHDVAHVLHGFEGELNEHFKRSTVNGWRYEGLPWEQM